MWPHAVVKDPDGVRRLNFARLVISYTRRFSQTDPREALQYFYLLKVWKQQVCTESTYTLSRLPFICTPLQGMEGGEGQDVFFDCVADLVMESREFEMVLGCILPDGSRKPGAVDKFLQDSSVLTGFVASQAEAQGLYEDAVRLYDLCKVGARCSRGPTLLNNMSDLCPQDHGKVLALLNQLLSSVASSPSSPQSQRARLQQLAVVVAERYKGCGHSAPESLAHTFFLLLDIMTFFDHYHSKRLDQALEVGWAW